MTTSTLPPGKAVAAAASSNSILTTLRPLFTHLIYTPARFIFLRAIPSVLRYSYLAVTYAIHYLIVMLRFALIPVLYPLDLFLWRPCMASIVLVYKYRYLICFTSSAIFLGCFFGFASFWLSSRLARSRTKAARSPTPQRTASIPSSKQEKVKLPQKSSGTTPVASSTHRRSSLTSKHQPPSSQISKSRPKEAINSKARTTNKRKEESEKASTLLFKKEEILVKSPESELGPMQPSKNISPPLKLNIDDNADMEGRDRFDQAMKALARQRKQSRLANPVL